MSTNTKFGGTLIKKDYINILKHYDKPLPNSAKKIQAEAEELLSGKLCRCIKKNNESVPIKAKQRSNTSKRRKTKAQTRKRSTTH